MQKFCLNLTLSSGRERYVFALSVLLLLKTLTVLSFLLTSGFCTDSGSDSDDLSEYTEKEPRFPEDYTLMLLDRSRTDWEGFFSGTQEDKYKVFMASQKDQEVGFSCHAHNDPFDYFVCKLVRNRYKRAAERLVDSLLFSEDVAEEPQIDVFSSAMILFPVEDDPDKVLAYLFGRWAGILNVDTIVKNFGLHVATSVGVFCSGEDRTNQELANIYQINSEERRQDKPIADRKRSRGGLYHIYDFKLEAGDSRIEELRFKPTAEWGRAYITANDAFRFRLSNSTDLISTLRDMALRLYTVFKRFSEETMYACFQDYIDTPIRGDLADELTRCLLENWADHLRQKHIYPHWTYWFRTQNVSDEDKGAIFDFWNQERLWGGEKVSLTSKYDGTTIEIPLLRLIRSAPIQHGSKYYWFDREDWFELSENRTQAMKEELEKHMVDYKSRLYLPSYDEESIQARTKKSNPNIPPMSESTNDIEMENPFAEMRVDEGSGYKEQLYNSDAIQHLNKQHPRVSWATLMDRENVIWSRWHDQFEFADIVSKLHDRYYLVHVKRARAKDLGHVCTQAERCGMFLSGRLNRSALTEPFMLAELYTHSALSGRLKKSSMYRKATIVDKHLSTDLYKAELLKLDVFRKPSALNDRLKEFINSPEFGLDFWINHNKLLLRMFDCVADIEERSLSLNTIHELQALAKTGIEKSSFFVEGELLPSSKRRKITVVVAIIEDDPFSLVAEDGSFSTNHIMRFYQTRQALLEKHFNFAWTTIPKTSNIPAETLADYTYTPEDMDKLLSLSIKSAVIENVLTRMVSKDSLPLTKPLVLNIGTQGEPRNIFVLQAKGDIFIAQAFKQKSGETAKSYIAEILAKFSKEKSSSGQLNRPFSFIVPYQTKDNRWVAIVLKFSKTGLTVQCLATIDDKKLKEDIETVIGGLVGLKDFKTAIKAINRNLKIGDEPTEVPVEMKIQHKQIYGHASGAFTVQNILEFVSLPSEQTEMTSDELKYKHLELLKQHKKDFEVTFEENPEEPSALPLIRRLFQPNVPTPVMHTHRIQPKQSERVFRQPVFGELKLVNFVQVKTPTRNEDDDFAVSRQQEVVFQWLEPSTGQRTAFTEGHVKGDGDCAFTALGTDRQSAITRLKTHTHEEWVRGLIRADLLARLIDPSDARLLPTQLTNFRVRFRDQHDEILNKIEEVRAQVNRKLGLAGDTGLERDQVANHIEDEGLAEHYRQELLKLNTITVEMASFMPTQEQINVFLQDEFMNRKEYLSYQRDGGGTLEALVQVMGVGVTVFTGDSVLEQTLHVPNLSNGQHFYLRHTGGMDRKGRAFLNHFNLLYQVPQSYIPLRDAS